VHLFMRSNLEKSQALIDVLAECDLQMALPKDTPTLQALSTRNFTRPDNVFISSSIVGHLICCRTLPDERPARADHIPIISELDLELDEQEETPCPNFKMAEWKAVRELLTAKLMVLGPAQETRTCRDVLCYHSPRRIFLTFRQDPLYSRCRPLPIYAAPPSANSGNLRFRPCHSFHPLTSSQFCFCLSQATHGSHPRLIHISPHLSSLHIKRGSLTLRFLSFLKEAVECDGKMRQWRFLMETRCHSETIGVPLVGNCI